MCVDNRICHGGHLSNEVGIAAQGLPKALDGLGKMALVSVAIAQVAIGICVVGVEGQRLAKAFGRRRSLTFVLEGIAVSYNTKSSPAPIEPLVVSPMCGIRMSAPAFAIAVASSGLKA